ncbi:hypothetical protein [Pseudobdellovibrio sp. HCB154]|uniref:hypothetical protein n=1 Tax=Pseudobdellovibrio sp. HCB154 TaxID=3386277 RepID=UPI0039170A36
MKTQIKKPMVGLLFSVLVMMGMGSKPASGTATTGDTDLKTSSESFAADKDKKPTTPNTSAEGVSERRGQNDPSDKHSWIGSRARGKALQTDKFPRPPQAASGTAQPKTRY